ncbi:hypothetical protein KFK09_011186 [Dendrobium nobile]|uniref:Uncharacterized protein n=1 Tax=Dendrobium nobile TaxID=94219 RepID=A0A8T3BF04_DENNO|nr:hypothetical protein KFK09_011186 [Dendrobium nobile]
MDGREDRLDSVSVRSKSAYPSSAVSSIKDDPITCLSPTSVKDKGFCTSYHVGLRKDPYTYARLIVIVMCKLYHWDMHDPPNYCQSLQHRVFSFLQALICVVGIFL